MINAARKFMNSNEKPVKEKKQSKKKRTTKILDDVTYGRKIKLLKLKDKINSGDYECHTGLLDVFEEIMDDAKKEKYE